MLSILAGASALAAGAVASYGMMAPESQLFGAAFARGSDPNQLALTYDDGPNGDTTLRLLEVLAKSNVHATFFLIGKWVKRQPEVARAIAAAGHDLGNHTYSHANMALLTPANIRLELESCRAVIEDTVGKGPKLFRPPWGARRPATLRIARELGLQPVMWNVTCYDWRPTTPERISQHVERQQKGGDVVLLHDGAYGKLGAERMHSVTATKMILRKYQAEGKSFVPISAMTSPPPRP